MKNQNDLFEQIAAAIKPIDDRLDNQSEWNSNQHEINKSLIDIVKQLNKDVSTLQTEVAILKIKNS